MTKRRQTTLKLHLRRLAAAGAVALAALMVAPPVAARDELEAASASEGQPLDHAEVMRLVESMEKAYAGVDDYTATFIKRERVKGRMQPREVMELKFSKPFKVYLRWVGDKREGQEVIFVKGRNDGKIKAHTGKFPDITVDLDPEGSLAMRGQRHPITDLGIGNTIDILARDARLAGMRPQDKVTYVDLGEQTVGGVRARCVEATTPSLRWSPYYAARARLCVGLRDKLPLRVLVWDRDGELIEDYTFKNVKLNVGLADVHFSAENPEYGF
ncbi:MAG: DUF1571 domain-containing protein [Myxococcales bacterium]|nr:DUF1571 domain-containing protein [Myxococcales bacterium]